jgi:FkbM family methyltransferase
VSVALKRFVIHAGRQVALAAVRYPRSLAVYQCVRITHRYGVRHVVDVGANAGQYAMHIRQFGYQGEILSFEPLSAAYEQLRRAAEHDGGWHAERSAIGRTSGEAQINIAGNSGSSSILPMLDRHVRAAPKSRYIGTECVPVQRLDEALERHRWHQKPIFLKVDTQGFEREVLSGLGEQTKNLVGLQMELSLVPLYAGQMLVDEAMAWAAAAGLRLASVEQVLFDRESGELLQMDGVFVRD